MDEKALYDNRKRQARLAGVFYIVLAFAALPDALRSRLFVGGDALATGRNIMANAALLRWSVIGDICTEIAFLLMGIVLYGLLKEVSRKAALMMLAMVAIASAMTIYNVGGETAAIGAFASGDWDHGMLLIDAFMAYKAPTAVFYGLWMAPLGFLFIKSSFMPKILGAILIVGSCGYVIHSVYMIAAPAVTERFVLISVVAEVAAIVWLLGFGVKKPKAA